MLALYLSLIEDDEARACFAQFYNRCFPRLLRAARSILPRQDLAEEAVHAALLKILDGHMETFLKIFRKSCDESMYWAVCIVKRTALDILEKENRSSQLPEDWYAPAPVEEDADPDYLHLVEMIRALPDIYRQALELRFLTGLDNQEIAHVLGISPTAVASRVRRGRELLAERLREEEIIDDR